MEIAFLSFFFSLRFSTISPLSTKNINTNRDEGVDSWKWRLQKGKLQKLKFAAQPSMLGSRCETGEIKEIKKIK